MHKALDLLFGLSALLLVVGAASCKNAAHVVKEVSHLCKVQRLVNFSGLNINRFSAKFSF